MTRAAKKTNVAAKTASAGKRGRVPAAAAASSAAVRRSNGRTPIASPQPKPTSKRDQLAELLVRDEGATIAQMQEATGWLAHTVRAALTGLKKQGYGIDSDKVGDVRTYRATAPQ